MRILYGWLVSLFFIIIHLVVMAQEEVLEQVGEALKAGSARELVKYIGNTVDININGNSNTYSKSQAEAYLRDFFNKNSVRDFRYIHQGSSPQQGLRYTIGKYVSDQSSFRVVMLLKLSGDRYRIDSITFSKE